MQLALEVLTGACATLPDPELGEEEEEIDAEEEGECGPRILAECFQAGLFFFLRYDEW